MKLPLSLRGLGEVLFRPGALFAELKNNPIIIVPFCVMIIIYIVFTMLVLEVISQPSIELFRERGVDFNELQQQGQRPVEKIRLLHIFDNIDIIIRPFFPVSYTHLRAHET